MENKAYWVYVLENPTGKRYIGYTENVPARLLQHNLGLSKWSAKYRPWKVIWTSQPMEKLQAYHLEQQLKRQGRGSGFYSITGINLRS